MRLSEYLVQEASAASDEAANREAMAADLGPELDAQAEILNWLAAHRRKEVFAIGRMLARLGRTADPEV